MVNNICSSVIFALRRNVLTGVLLAVALGLAYVLRQPLRLFPAMVDWNTIFTLSGLLLITTGIKESGLFYLLAYRISRRIDNERLLALFLVFLAAILSMFLTNDIALFIVVPITLTLQQIVESDYSKIIIFEAIAVNVGSSLTPIGNPQNIYLWHQWGISFHGFVREMMPVVSIMSIGLIAMIFLCFPSKKIEVANNHNNIVDRGLFIISAILLVVFVSSIELGYETYFLPIILFVILITRKSIFLKCDWGLVLLFIIIFIDLNLICRFKAVNHLLAMLDFSNVRVLFLSSALFSQVISNVPSAILLTNHSSNFKIIAYGVNIGGNGLLIGSFANLIALRFSNRKYNYFSFHVYSLPYFIITLISSFYFNVINLRNI
jgi:Na+/H+ antiporter NhaD/arsenite permease-like protein